MSLSREEDDRESVGEKTGNCRGRTQGHEEDAIGNTRSNECKERLNSPFEKSTQNQLIDQDKAIDYSIEKSWRVVELLSADKVCREVRW